MAVSESTPARDRRQRIADTLARFGEFELDGWVATAGKDGAHLIPLTVAYLDGLLVLAISATSRTARHLSTGDETRIGFGPTRDVILVDAAVDRVESVEQAAPELVQRYVDQAGWDPRQAPGYRLVQLRPLRFQAWREVNEISGRTLMRDGRWLD